MSNVTRRRLISNANKDFVTLWQLSRSKTDRALYKYLLTEYILRNHGNPAFFTAEIKNALTKNKNPLNKIQKSPQIIQQLSHGFSPRKYKHNKMDPKNDNKGLIIIFGVLLKCLRSFLYIFRGKKVGGNFVFLGYFCHFLRGFCF